MDIKITGIEDTGLVLEAKRDGVERGRREGLASAGQLLEAEIMSSITGAKAEPRSIDTGEFLNSIDSKASDDSFVVSSSALHSIFLEKGTSKMPPRRHFENSLERRRQDIINKISGDIRSNVE